jgi:hypothetical protein
VSEEQLNALVAYVKSLGPAQAGSAAAQAETTPAAQPQKMQVQ